MAIESHLEKYPDVQVDKNKYKVVVKNNHHDNIGIYRFLHPAEEWKVETLIHAFFDNKSDEWMPALKQAANITTTEENIEFSILKSEVNNADEFTKQPLKAGKYATSYFMIGWSGNNVPKKSRYFWKHHKLDLVSIAKYCTTSPTLFHTRWSCKHGNHCFRCNQNGHATGNHFNNLAKQDFEIHKRWEFVCRLIPIVVG
ncbi:retrotransposon-related protein, putative [Candida dubliniensis CD36]|uniref:Retrotransposon-related protein, putative n=1 Tax=Candida dubliniensis (strain CD36 / ATCC MYA-646 / CBS 7987 / NCPF 3949 / NRRL Y-17841) TaxID=573826 RepID=B9WCZ0_CANDC|nr:retrotransposon-related protein, putative [Candida dubliniensis CD36]CAX42539.1 retrotransposon-related protein, putative [Candida dubliniensis CD36]